MTAPTGETTATLDNAIRLALDSLVRGREFGDTGHGFIIINVPAVGPNGGHYHAGFRVFKNKPQAPGGFLPPGELPPGEIVARIDEEGNVTVLTAVLWPLLQSQHREVTS